MKDISLRKILNSMIEIIITLDKEAIYTEVKKLAAYSGKKQTDATDDVTYDVLHITKAEEEMLDQFYNEAEGVIMDVLKPFVKDITADGVKCKMPTIWDPILKGTMQSTVNDVMKSLIAAKWFRINQAKNTEQVYDDANQKLMELKRELYWRKRPAQPSGFMDSSI